MVIQAVSLCFNGFNILSILRNLSFTYIAEFVGIVHNTHYTFFFNIFIYLSAVLCLVTQSCPTLCNPMDCSLPGPSVHRDSPDKNTECPPGESSPPRDQTQVSCFAGRLFSSWATQEAQSMLGLNCSTWALAQC